ncbi:MAG: hypothetical protein U0807_00745 [Candidatus Binatia bacterium]
MPTIEMTPLVLLATTAVDVAAVGALAWLLARGARQRIVVLDDQRAALETLRGDLGRLLEEAEQRARALERSLAARERSLRSVVGAIGRAEEAADDARQDRPLRPVKPLTREPVSLGESDLDPGEARLLADLELSLGRGRSA